MLTWFYIYDWEAYYIVKPSDYVTAWCIILDLVYLLSEFFLYSTELHDNISMIYRQEIVMKKSIKLRMNVCHVYSIVWTVIKYQIEWLVGRNVQVLRALLSSQISGNFNWCWIITKWYVVWTFKRQCITYHGYLHEKWLLVPFICLPSWCSNVYICNI